MTALTRQPETTKFEASAPSSTEVLQGIRRKRVRRLSSRLAVGVLLPTALAALYYFFWASDQYESTSLFNIQSAEVRGAPSIESLFGGLPVNSSDSRDALMVRDYVLSREVLRRLDEAHEFVDHYQASENDWIARLGADASFEDAFAYYEDKVRVEYDTNSGVLKLTTVAFGADKAKEFAQAILEYSEEMVNELSARARADQTSFAQSELERAEQRLGAARQNLLRLQAEQGEFSPEHSATETLGVRGGLQAEVAKARAELSALRAYLQPGAPKVIEAQQRINALSSEIQRASRQLVDPGKDRINTSIVEFESAVLEKELSQHAYTSALASLEIARNEAARQHRYLVTIAPPSHSDEATRPHRIIGIFTVFALSITVLGIGALLVAAVREHAKV